MSMFEFLFSPSDQDETGKAFDAALAAAFPAPIPEWAKRADDKRTPCEGWDDGH